MHTWVVDSWGPSVPQILSFPGVFYLTLALEIGTETHSDQRALPHSLSVAWASLGVKVLIRVSPVHLRPCSSRLQLLLLDCDRDHELFAFSLLKLDP